MISELGSLEAVSSIVKSLLPEFTKSMKDTMIFRQCGAYHM